MYHVSCIMMGGTACEEATGQRDRAGGRKGWGSNLNTAAAPAQAEYICTRAARRREHHDAHQSPLPAFSRPILLGLVGLHELEVALWDECMPTLFALHHCPPDAPTSPDNVDYLLFLQGHLRGPLRLERVEGAVHPRYECLLLRVLVAVVPIVVILRWRGHAEVLVQIRLRRPVTILLLRTVFGAAPREATAQGIPLVSPPAPRGVILVLVSTG